MTLDRPTPVQLHLDLRPSALQLELNALLVGHSPWGPREHSALAALVAQHGLATFGRLNLPRDVLSTAPTLDSLLQVGVVPAQISRSHGDIPVRRLAFLEDAPAEVHDLLDRAGVPDLTEHDIVANALDAARKGWVNSVAHLLTRHREGFQPFLLTQGAPFVATLAVEWGRSREQTLHRAPKSSGPRPKNAAQILHEKHCLLVDLVDEVGEGLEHYGLFTGQGAAVFSGFLNERRAHRRALALARELDGAVGTGGDRGLRPRL